MINTLMMVDDCRFERKMVKRLINKTGLVDRMLEFGMAEDAIHFLRAPDCPKIDALIIDINMPRMNGFEFLEEIAEDWPDHLKGSVVVILTSSECEADVERAESYPVVRSFLRKPIGEAEIARLDTLVNS
ncbi:response regulator [Rhodovulum visakhapatnamense]|nr:response regulator [Rhodovulum visakhapatnamense]MBL3571110.1 response regulator [Rhodovulum visakhapatnamense]